MRLDGGVAIVTGAGGGIGGAVARRLAAEGMALVLADRDPATLGAVADEVRAAGGAVAAVVGDVGEPDHHDELVAAARSLGGLRLSVLNAGVYLPGLSWEQPVGAWDLHVRVNLWGVVHGVRAAVPELLAGGLGHVVAVASGAGLVAPPGLAPYVATKHAVVGLVESLHHELARVRPDGAVGASVVCPGDVRTPMAANSAAAADAAGVPASAPVGSAPAPSPSAGPEPSGPGPAGSGSSGSGSSGSVSVGDSVAATVRAGNAAGEDPSTVADAIVDAVSSEPRRFWVLPQLLVALGALDRYQRLADGRPPADLLP